MSAPTPVACTATTPLHSSRFQRRPSTQDQGPSPRRPVTHPWPAGSLATRSAMSPRMPPASGGPEGGGGSHTPHSREQWPRTVVGGFCFLPYEEKKVSFPYQTRITPRTRHLQRAGRGSMAAIPSRWPPYVHLVTFVRLGLHGRDVLMVSEVCRAPPPHPGTRSLCWKCAPWLPRAPADGHVGWRRAPLAPRLQRGLCRCRAVEMEAGAWNNSRHLCRDCWGSRTLAPTGISGSFWSGVRGGGCRGRRATAWAGRAGGLVRARHQAAEGGQEGQG